MFQIRRGIFETNSSSTHSIVISKKKLDMNNLPKELHFRVGKFDWSEERCNTADYLYTALLDLERKKQLKQLKAILADLNVKAIFHKPSKDEDFYINHSCELEPFIDQLFRDTDLLLRYLFGDSCVYTGNDCLEGNPMCWCAEPMSWNPETCKEYPNPNHKPDEYDYYFKVN